MLCLAFLVHTFKEIGTIKVPVLSPKTPRGLATETFPIILPHNIIKYLIEEVGISLDTRAIREFWEHAKAVGEGWARAASSQHIPLGLHGDCAQTWTRYRKEKLLCISLSLLHFRPRSTRYSRFLLFAIPKEKVFKNRTINTVLRHIVRSVNMLYTGVDSRTGNPIVSTGQRFMLVELRGDWEWHRDVWRFHKTGWNSVQVCHRCPATSKGDPDNSFSNSGSALSGPCSWIQNEFNLDQFVSLRLKTTNL